MPQAQSRPPVLDRIEVRRAVSGDIPVLHAIEQARFTGDRLTRRSLTAFLRRPSAIFLVAARGVEPLGYAVALTRRGSRMARLYSIAVTEAAAGRGVGARLLRAVEDAAAACGAGALRLEVRADNQAAIRFYEGQGYRPDGVRDGYYSDGMEARRYRRRLAPLPDRRAA